MSEDQNGNLLSDAQGTSYAWNERNQLARAAHGSSNVSTFWYDAFGRRIETTNGTSSSTFFLYDGLNPVQEQNTSTGQANLLTGLGLDEIFTRSDTSGMLSFLTNELGSTTALVNSGSVQTQYTYGPFGATTPSGTTNPYQFTGRELDPNSGLYFMRNRYYSPSLSRFISPDPMGIAGGDANLYAYADNDPTNLVDPLGLCAGVGGGGGGGEPGACQDDPSQCVPVIPVFLGGQFSAAGSPGGTTSLHQHSCSGRARILQGNPGLIGQPGGFATPTNPIAVVPNSAAVIPGQFGTMAQLRVFGPQISGTSSGALLFSGVSDVIGGTSPIAGMNVRDALQKLNPGALILELPNAPDMGTKPVIVSMPNSLPCPQGTE